MGLTITNQPTDSFYFASEALRFTFTPTDIPPAGSTEKTAYTVYGQDVGGGNNGPLSKQKSRPVYSLTDIVDVDILEYVKTSLGTVVPTLDGTDTAINDPDFAKQFAVNYKEILIDGNGDITTPVDATTTYRTIINAYIQDYQSITKGAAHILTDKKYLMVPFDCHDWIRCYGAYDVTFRFYDVTGAEIALSSLNYTGTDKLVPSGPAQLTVPAGTIKYTATFTSGEVITYVLYNQVYDANKRVDVYFQEPKGSWTVMPFKMVSQETLSRDFREIYMGGEITNDVATIFENYGRGIVNLRSWRGIRLEKMVRSHDENIEYYRSFANARQWRIAYKDSEGTINQNLVPFIPEISNIPISDKEGFFNFTLTGYYGVDLK